MATPDCRKIISELKERPCLCAALIRLARLPETTKGYTDDDDDRIYKKRMRHLVAELGTAVRRRARLKDNTSRLRSYCSHRLFARTEPVCHELGIDESSVLGHFDRLRNGFNHVDTCSLSTVDFLLAWRRIRRRVRALSHPMAVKAMMADATTDPFVWLLLVASNRVSDLARLFSANSELQSVDIICSVVRNAIHSIAVSEPPAKVARFARERAAEFRFILAWLSICDSYGHVERMKSAFEG